MKTIKVMRHNTHDFTSHIPSLPFCTSTARTPSSSIHLLTPAVLILAPFLPRPTAASPCPAPPLQVDRNSGLRPWMEIYRTSAVRTWFSVASANLHRPAGTGGAALRGERGARCLFWVKRKLLGLGHGKRQRLVRL